MTTDPYALSPGGPAAVATRTPRERVPYPAAPSWLAAAALGAGAVAAVALPERPFGLGTVLAIGAIGAAVGAAVRRRPEPSDVLLASLLLALLSMFVLRDAEWLLALDLLAVATLGTLVLAGARTWHAFIAAGVSIWARLAPALPYVLGPLARRSAAVTSPRHRGAVRGSLLAVVLLVVFGALFASADAAFASLLGGLVPTVDDLLVARLVVGAFAVALVGAGVLTRLRPVAVPPLPEPVARSRAEWAVPLVALDTLFAAFVAVQLAVLFGGREHVVATNGLTYAEYARQGFFQLVAVVALTLALIAFVVARVSFEDARERLVARAVLLPLCALAFVVLASAWRRLGLYESVYGLTRLRLFVHAVIVGLALLLAVVVVALARWRGEWLPRAFAAVAAATLLGLNVANPDALIARRAVETGRIDPGYLVGLSADAAPDLARIGICVDLPERESWLSWNAARDTARHAACR
jgi:hypothetical protein